MRFDNDHQYYKSIESKNKDQSKIPLRVLEKVETNQKPITKRPYHYTIQAPPMPYDLQQEYEEENKQENDSGTSSTFLN